MLYKYLDSLSKCLLFLCWYYYVLLDHWSPLRLENVYPWIIKHAWSGQLLLIWILMSFITIHLPLVWSEFDGRKCNWRPKWNKDKCQCEREKTKTHRLCEDDNVWNSTAYACECDKFVRLVNTWKTVNA